MKNKLPIIIVLLVIIIVVVAVILFKKLNDEKPVKPTKPSEPVVINTTGDFTIDLLRSVNEEKNFLISPYSIEVALNMLRTGANGETKEEFDKVLPQRNLTISNENVKVSNALFVKDMYKSVIESSFEKELKNKYNSTVLYDKFKTPKVINEWVKESTDGMIEKILDNIDPEFVLGLANAIAIDVKWSNEFECESTTSEQFDTSNNTMNVEMMHQTYMSGVKYIDEDNIKGITIPYKENLEFIALLPSENLKNYVNNLTREELNNTLNKFKSVSSGEKVYLSLPRFSYEYNIDNFIEVLNAVGITKVFNPSEADLSKIITKENLNKLGRDNIYVSDAIHKTYIDLNEIGTKAAAVTYFGVKATGAFIDESKIIYIKLNKPFLYMIFRKCI